jgi:integrase
VAAAFGKVRDGLGVPDVTSHSFRKSVTTIIDEAGLSARVGADQLGHAKVSMTQDRYMRRGKVHPEVAALLDRSITGE